VLRRVEADVATWSSVENHCPWFVFLVFFFLGIIVAVTYSVFSVSIVDFSRGLSELLLPSFELACIESIDACLVACLVYRFLAQVLVNSGILLNPVEGTMESLLDLLPRFLLVGALWGCTNPLLKKGTEATNKCQGDGSWSNYFSSVWATLTNVGFIVPFLLNQSGSLLYVYLLGSSDLSMAVPICNSLTFVFTAVTSIFLGEQVQRPLNVCVGVVSVLFGVAICIYSKTEYKQLSQ
jgi:hypothetical protein